MPEVNWGLSSADFSLQQHESYVRKWFRVPEVEKPDDGLMAMLRRALDPSRETKNPQGEESREMDAEYQLEPVLSPEMEPQPSAEVAEPDKPEPAGRTILRSRTAGEIEELILNALARIPNAPKTGMTITVYGYRHWNAMATFAPGSTDAATAATIRTVLKTVTDRLRAEIDIEIPKD